MRRISLLRLRPLLIATALALPVIWGLAWLAEPGRFPVRQVEIDSDAQRADRDAVRRAALEQTAAGLLHIDVHELSRALETQDWVDRVAARRLWPDRLQLTLTEHRPAAHWGDAAWLNHRGEIFHAAARPGLDHLPRFDAPTEAAATVLRRYRAFQERLDETGPQITHIIVDNRSAWRVELDNGVALRLGRRNLDRRAERFLQAWNGPLAAHAKRIRNIDLRYPHGLAVAWKTTEG